MTRQPRVPIERLRELGNKHLNTTDPELITLKAHVLVEAALAHLLAARLNAQESDLPDLTFAELARLALAGLAFDRLDPLRSGITMLNTLRNQLAHQLEAATLEHRMRDIVSLAAAELDFRFDWPADAAIRVASYRNAMAWITGSLAALHVIVLAQAGRAPVVDDIGNR